MYSPRIISNRLEAAHKALGFLPEYRSLSEVDDFTERMERKYSDAYAVARRQAQGSKEGPKVFQSTLQKLLHGRLSSDEIRWMRNERAMVMCDASYFLTRYYYILNDENIEQRFSFETRPGQVVLHGVAAELEDRGAAIEILDAKARQLGITTWMVGLELQRVAFSPGVNAVAASADASKTREMVKKLLMAYDKLPWWMRPVYTRRVESDQGFMYFGDAGITFQHGEQTNPIAMGSTVTVYHLSECSSYPDPAQTIEVGLFKAVHPSPRVLGVLESTCKGNTGWWADYYWFAKREWKNGISRHMALFLPFYCAANMYPNPTELKMHPVPTGWRPIKETRLMMKESAEYVKSNAVLSRVMMKDGKDWSMPKEQAWYWEWNFLSARAKGGEKDWFSEMPHSDRVAFQSSYDNVFGREVIAAVYSGRKPEYEVYGLIGQSIEDRHEPEPDEVDHDKDIVTITMTNRRNVKYSWEAIPLEWREPFESLEELHPDDEEHMGKLFIFKHPEPGYDYSIGVRTSVGIGTDPTVIAVCRRARHSQDHDIQAAEFRDIDVSHVEAYAWGAAIAAYYGKYMNPEHGMTRYFQPYVAIEQVRSVGDTCQLQMRKMGHSRFHHMTRYDSKPDQMRKNKAHKIGWFTHGWSEPILMDGFVVLVKNGWYQLNSPYTIWEADHWEVHQNESGKTTYLPEEDMTAHGLWANALAAFCPNDMKPLAERTLKRYMEIGGQEKKPILDLEPTKYGTSFPLSPPKKRAS